MSWNTEYIIIRTDASGCAQIVHEARSIKDSRYWLQYIALPGDAIFTTSLHPKYSGNGTPLYSAHLVSRGKIEHDEAKWRKQVLSSGVELQLPTESPFAGASAE